MQTQPHQIGVVVRYVGGYYFGAMLAAIHRASQSAGVSMLVIQAGLQDLSVPLPGAHHVHGWIVIHPFQDDAVVLASLISSGKPVVTLLAMPEGIACTSVSGDDRGDTRRLVDHLIEHGHRRIACLDHGTDPWARARRAGYDDALRAAGIAVRPDWIIDTSQLLDGADGREAEFLRQRGELAARELLAAGLPCTALVAGTDASAIAAMRVFQAAGKRVPEDIAVVGFDDIDEAAFCSPPLTTMRTRFDRLASAAAGHLLGVLRGERDARPAHIVLPTTLVQRGSCGCAATALHRAAEPPAPADLAEWHRALVRRLGDTVTAGQRAPADATGAPWPAAAGLVDAMEAALAGASSEDLIDDIALACRQAVAITENEVVLDTAVTLLEEAAEQRLAVLPTGSRADVDHFRRELRRGLMAARLACEAAKTAAYRSLGGTNQSIGTALLGSRIGECQTLDWLRLSPATWGCLALWDDPPAEPDAALRVAGLYRGREDGPLAIGSTLRAAAFPPFDALPAAVRRGDDLTIVSRVVAGDRELGLLAVCGFAGQNFVSATSSVWVNAGTLGSAIQRDRMILDLEAQTQVLSRARDAAEEANRAKNKFLANMSHELRTPLNGILGFGHLLQLDPGLTDKQKRGLSTIEDCGRHLLGLIDDILELARLGAEKVDLLPTPMKLHGLLEEVADIIGVQAQARALGLVLESIVDPDLIVLVDGQRLRQVLLNLLSNAVKFTDTGGVTLRARAEPGAGGSMRLKVEVADTGIGLSESQLARLFQPFEQVAEGKRREGGTGLGLSISQRLIGLMGGAIQVRSRPGEGSVFSFDIVLPVQHAPLQGQLPDGLPTGHDGPVRRVLVVDDVAHIRSLLADMLGRLGFEVAEAADGDEALAKVASFQPELIVLDLTMPVVDGFEVMRRLRRLTGLGGTVPVIATSASAAPDTAARSLDAGAMAFIGKPIEPALLLAEMALALDLRWVRGHPGST